jgi:carbonic anhydrase
VFEIIFQHDPSKRHGLERPIDAKQARARLIDGNTRFSSLWADDSTASQRLVVPSDLEELLPSEMGKTPEHHPFAAVLSCSDARVPTELLFLEPLNELFVVRLAGNVVGNESVGSLNYAVQHLGDHVKLMVVLGHTGCGAVSAAVDAYLDPTHSPLMTGTLGLRSLVEHIFVSVRTAARALNHLGVSPTEDPRYRSRLTAVSEVVNGAIAAMTLEQVLGSSIRSDCGVVFGVYDLATRQVFAPDGSGLTEPPSTLEELDRLAVQIASSRNP